MKTNEFAFFLDHLHSCLVVSSRFKSCDRSNTHVLQQLDHQSSTPITCSFDRSIVSNDLLLSFFIRRLLVASLALQQTCLACRTWYRQHCRYEPDRLLFVFLDSASSTQTSIWFCGLQATFPFPLVGILFFIIFFRLVPFSTLSSHLLLIFFFQYYAICINFLCSYRRICVHLTHTSRVINPHRAVF